MATRASIAGHPIHPMLVTLPIGLWVFSLVSDIIGLMTARPDWFEIAYITDNPSKNRCRLRRMTTPPPVCERGRLSSRRPARRSRAAVPCHAYGRELPSAECAP